MNAEMREKYKRLQDRLSELSVLNGNIARLALYLNENKPEGTMSDTMWSQATAMEEYRDALQVRIKRGWY